MSYFEVCYSCMKEQYKAIKIQSVFPHAENYNVGCFYIQKKKVCSRQKCCSILNVISYTSFLVSEAQTYKY